VLTSARVGFVALGLSKAVIGYLIFGALGSLRGESTLRPLRRAGSYGHLAEKADALPSSYR
jgi:hypothetical protein